MIAKTMKIQILIDSELNKNNEYLNYQEKDALTKLGYECAKEFATKTIAYRIFYHDRYLYFSGQQELNNYLEKNNLSRNYKRDEIITYSLTYKL